MSEQAHELKIYVPPTIYKKLMDIQEQYKINLQDILLRAIVKTIEEFLGEKAYEA